MDLLERAGPGGRPFGRDVSLHRYLDDPRLFGVEPKRRGGFYSAWRPRRRRPRRILLHPCRFPSGAVHVKSISR